MCQLAMNCHKFERIDSFPFVFFLELVNERKQSTNFLAWKCKLQK